MSPPPNTRKRDHEAMSEAALEITDVLRRVTDEWEVTITASTCTITMDLSLWGAQKLRDRLTRPNPLAGLDGILGGGK